MRKILILGGTEMQIPAINKAREMGLYVITCDYLPANPGHKFANEYFNVSTTDKEGVLNLAGKLKIDAVLAYASDPAAPTAAYVSEKLGLPGSSYESVLSLFRKDKFRELLKRSGMNTPAFHILTNESRAKALFSETKPGKLIFKPADSSASKGVSVATNPQEAIQAFRLATEFSREKIVIAEEFIERNGSQIGGEGFVVDGKLVFTCFGDVCFNPEINPFLPFAQIMPSTRSEKILNKAREVLQQIITACGYKTGGLNLDIMLDKNEELLFIEIGPRCGGNMLPQLVEYCTGIDLTDLAIKAAIGESCPAGFNSHAKKTASYIVLYTKQKGRLLEFQFEQKLDSRIFFKYFNVLPGEYLAGETGVPNRLGVLLAAYENPEEAFQITDNFGEYCRIIVRAGL
jgi:biotin carboxylase